MAQKMAIHTVEGLPSNVYTITEHKVGPGKRFIPKMSGRPFVRSEAPHGVAWFDTLEDATQMLYDFLSRMQS